jgi:hypothetical protein
MGLRGLREDCRMDEDKSAYSSFVDAAVRIFPAYFHHRRQKRTLRVMLRDKSFPKGFRSTDQLMNGIGGDRQSTERSLVFPQALACIA